MGCACGWTAPLVYRSRNAQVKARAAHLGPIRERCRECGVLLATETRATTGALECRECRHHLYEKRWREANADRFKRRRLSAHYTRKYGITIEQYEQRLAEQGGVCAVCGEPPGPGERGGLHVDHCHDTGRVRGLLCMPCNQGLGQFRDNAAIMRRAITYLEKNS